MKKNLELKEAFDRFEKDYTNLLKTGRASYYHYIYNLDEYISDLIKCSNLKYNDDQTIMKDMLEYVLKMHELDGILQPVIPLYKIFPHTYEALYGWVKEDEGTNTNEY